LLDSTPNPTKSSGEELLGLSKLAALAFECSLASSDDNSIQGLFDIGLTAGRKCLEGYKNLAIEEKTKIVSEVPVDILYHSGPVDFQLGQLYAEKERQHYEELNINFADRALSDVQFERMKREKMERMFRQKNCFLVR
jgi:hypothetical protein